MPRIIIQFQTPYQLDVNSINKHNIQAYIYERLRETPYNALHELKGYKYFAFSDIMYGKNNIYSFFISSPDKHLLKYLLKQIKDFQKIKFGKIEGEILKATYKHIKLKKVKFITASPVVLSHNKKYISFYHGSNIRIFLELLKKNAVDKYNSFYNDEYYLEGELFERLEFKKSVSLKIRLNRKDTHIIGSTWKRLEKPLITSQDEKKFYQFLFDAGIGIKNSLGFGALNEHPSLLKTLKNTKLTTRPKDL